MVHATELIPNLNGLLHDFGLHYFEISNVMGNPPPQGSKIVGKSTDTLAQLCDFADGEPKITADNRGSNFELDSENPTLLFLQLFGPNAPGLRELARENFDGYLDELRKGLNYANGTTSEKNLARLTDIVSSYKKHIPGLFTLQFYDFKDESTFGYVMRYQLGHQSPPDHDFRFISDVMQKSEGLDIFDTLLLSYMLLEHKKEYLGTLRDSDKVVNGIVQIYLESEDRGIDALFRAMDTYVQVNGINTFPWDN